jgi:murein DD-endopeptidase MepM/ murein hydrolase activator NlpD
MKSTSPDKRNGAAARRAFALAASMAAIGAMAIGTATASAQGGGTTPPAEPPPPSTGTAPSPHAQVFPVPGPHTYGDGFGAGRRHMGQDIMAACGEPLVSVSWARVIYIKKHARAGHYMVLRYKKLKQDYMYAHLAGPPVVPLKAKVAPGQLVGYVGRTGNASACHLHFELWSGRWYRGGRAVNPTYWLQQWDAYS